MLCWARHQYAPYFLAGVSFAESSFFPIPPDVMLIPMVLVRPLNAWHYAFITTLASALGGILGYLIGYYAFDFIEYSLIVPLNYTEQYYQVVQWFAKYGWLAVLFAAGITPIPYKLFTIAAGAAMMPLLGFITASILGRATRFFLVALLAKTLGKKLEEKLIKYIDWAGWGLLLAVLLIYLGYHVYKI